MKRNKGLIFALLLATSITFVGCGTSNSGENSNKTDVNQSSKSEKNDESKSEFKYYSAEKLKNAIEKKENIIILDIQVEDDFNKHHIKGALPTYAYPVKTDEEKSKLDSSLDKLNSSKDPIIIVCPGGAGGAERTYGYLKEKNIDENRLFILENGQKNWPYDELLEK